MSHFSPKNKKKKSDPRYMNNMLMSEALKFFVNAGHKTSQDYKKILVIS